MSDDLMKNLFENRKEQILTLLKEQEAIVSKCVSYLLLELEKDSKRYCAHFEDARIISATIHITSMVTNTISPNANRDRDFEEYCHEITRKVMHKMQQMNIVSHDDYIVSYSNQTNPTSLTVQINQIRQEY